MYLIGEKIILSFNKFVNRRSQIQGHDYKITNIGS